MAISVVGSSFLFSSVEKVDPVLENATAIAKKLFYADEVKKDEEKEEKKRETIVSSYLQGLDGEQDYIISESIAGGYAIFEKESMELIEYSAVGGSPFSAIAGDYRGYAGPNAYFEKEGQQFKDIHTNKKLSKEKGLQVATKIKNKITTDRAERKEKLEQEKKELSKYGQTSDGKSQNPGPTGDLVVDADLYTVLSQVHIPDYQFFLGNNGHGYNKYGSCCSVAAQLLLAYNNWSKDGRLLDESNLPNDEVIFLPNRDSKDQEPYSKERIGTTSSHDLDDNIKSFYEVLMGYINPDITWDEDDEPTNWKDKELGATLYETYNGIINYLSNRFSQYTIIEERADMPSASDSNTVATTLQDKQIHISYSNSLASQISVKNKIIAEINNGRPVWVDIDTYENVGGTYTKEGHAVVVYGYQTIMYDGQSLDGFIAHFGWKSSTRPWELLDIDKTVNNTHTWFNSAWIDGYITFTMGHTHTTTPHLNNGHILKCDCGITATTLEHSYGGCKPLFNESIFDKHHIYHQYVCSCGYMKKEEHDYSTYIDYDNREHIVRCSTGCNTEFREWHTYTRFESQGAQTHKKYCALCPNVVSEDHLFKNNTTCMFCGELNHNIKGGE